MAPSTGAELLALYRQLSDTALAEFHEQLEQMRQQRVAKATAAAAGRRTHRVTGRLVFASPAGDGQKRPLHSLRVELWDRDFGPDDFLAMGVSDRDGRFEIWYNPEDAGWKDRPDLDLRVHEWDHTYDSRQEPVFSYRLVASVAGPEDIQDEHYDFGEIPVAYWEYDPHAVTPRLYVPEHASPPQAYPPGRAVHMLQQLGSIEIKKRLHLAEHRLDPQRPSLEKIQADYPENLTMRLERQRPGLTRSDEFFGQRILNGMSASILDRDPRNPQRLWLHHHWNSYEQDDVHAMPNVDVWFELRGDQPIPVEIALQFRRRGHTEENAPQDEPLHFTAADGPRWEQAKHLARVSAALYAELDVHLCQTHLNTEQYALAIYRNLRQNPLRRLLHPHLKEVVLINREADSWLLGDTGYIARATAFTPASLAKRLRQSLGTLDWKNWQPRRVLCAGHQYARAAQLFWQVLSQYVEWFFEQHRQEIAEHWYEVHRFSVDLVEHSVPFFLCGYLRGGRRGQAAPGSSLLGDWFEPNERMDLAIPRVEVDGQERAVQPVTDSEVCDEQGWQNMQQVCRYVIYHASFAHTWSNSRQHDDGGELAYNGLGLRYGNQGVFCPESDHSILPPPDQASEQLWFGWLLSRTGYGFLMKNEEHDIHPKLIALLRAVKSDFAALGIDINSIQSRTNI